MVADSDRASERRSSSGSEHFVEFFEDRSRDTRGLVIEPPRQVPQNAFGLLISRAVPGLTQHLFDAGVQQRVEPSNNIAPLVHLAALDQRKAKVLICPDSSDHG
jgi:hypothetical protein